ncbi:MAG: peptide chain release factor N(5)-glutamine methyltransferase [Myxococcota bacterium]
MSEQWTVLGVLNWTTGYFEHIGARSARLDAEVLLADVLGMERILLYAHHDRPLTAEERARYREAVKRRGRGEPVQYILGRQEFWSIPFRVEPGCLVPRPETEILVDEALAEARRLQEAGETALRVADVGTGTGCIPVALATELTEARFLAGDVADVPLRVAADNAEAAGVADRVRVLRADGLMPLWEAGGREPLHLVLSNPPYLRDDELPGTMREVRDWEPEGALAAGPEGLDVIRPLVAAAAEPGVMAAGGALVLEVGGGEQAEQVRGIMEGAGFVGIRVREDYAGFPRVVVGRRASG